MGPGGSQDQHQRLVVRYSAILRYVSLLYPPIARHPLEGSLTCDTPPLTFTLFCMQANVNLRPCGPGTDYKNPLNPENTKKNYEKNTRSPFPGWGPKIQKNYRKNTKMAQKSIIFSVIFSYFRAPTREGGSCIFFRDFFVFSGFRGLCNLYQARRIANVNAIGVCMGGIAR